MSTVTRVPVSGETAAISNAPRVITTTKTTRYEFRSFEAFVACLEDGTMKLHISANLGKDELPYSYTFKGQYSDCPAGDVFIALKGKMLEVMDSSNKHVMYDLLPMKATDYLKRKEFEDTQAVFDQANIHISEALQKVFDLYYPNQASSIHNPKRLKLKTPVKTGRKTVIIGGGVEDHDEGVELTELLADLETNGGKLMLKIGSPWLMTREKEQHVLMGMGFNLSKTPYRTDAEKAVIALKEQAAKKKREADEKRELDDESSKAKKSKTA